MLRNQKTTDDSHESAVQRARRLRFSPQFGALPEKTQQQIKRVSNVTMLTAPMVEVLDRETAPFRVCRWVAWGSALQDRVVRLALVLHMRGEVDARNPGRAAARWLWAKDPVLTAGERAFYASPQYAQINKFLGERRQSNATCVATITMHWDRVWNLVQRAVSTIDAQRFSADAQRAASTRRRRIMRKRHARKLGPKEAAAIDALDTLKRLVIRGELTVGELSDEIARQKTAGPPPAKKKARQR